MCDHATLAVTVAVLGGSLLVSRNLSAVRDFLELGPRPAQAPPSRTSAGPAHGACPACAGSRYNCDEWIRWDPRKYSCESLERDWGCDCSGCGRCGMPLTLFNTARHGEARCLDGSMAGFYLRRGAARGYLIYLEGGGWCYDDHCERPTRRGTLLDCTRRSQTRLGSSRQWPQSKAGLTGMLSSDPAENPVFHNWTLVYVPYCDGMSFSGNASVEGLHFRGASILRALTAELISSTGIRRAGQVVVSGGSAGASAVYYHVDAIARDLQLESGEVLGLPDAGFFLDLADKDGISCWPSQMRALFDVGEGYASLDAKCLARFPGERWRCLFPEYYVDLLATRVFAINSLYDTSELWYTLRLDCCPAGGCGGRWPRCSRDKERLFQLLRGEHIRAWAPLLNKTGSNVWAPACAAHTLTWERWTDATWEVPAGSGNTQAAAVQRWLSGEDGGSDRPLYQDTAAWPHNAPCAQSDLMA